jgi:hypothetical protein
MQKLNKFNQYLLERYPTVWNTKIVWMLLAALVFHIVFFIIGYVSHIDPVSLQKYSVKDDYFRNGVIFIHLIISILLIVGWLLMMLKNNAFKNFYPTSKGKLFGQFVQYFIIIFSCTTFYFSYMTGFRMFINNKYPDQEMAKNVDIINRTAPFLSQNIESYTLENRLFPKPFFDLYCENNIEKIDRNKKFFVYYNRVYQYYTLYSKKSYQKDKKGNFIPPNPEYSNKIQPAYSDEEEKFETFYYKKDVVDLSSQIQTTQPSFYNFSEIFYDYDFKSFDDGVGAVDANYYDKNSPDYILKNKKAIINQKTAALLNSKNSAELEKLFEDFLSISKTYSVRNNLNAKKWVSMIYSKDNPNFEVRYFIKDYGGKTRIDEDAYYEETVAVDSVVVAADYPNENDIRDSIKISEFNPEINQQLAPDKYVKNNMTEYYYLSENMKDLLKNVDSVKKDDFFSDNVHIYIWIAFFLSTFIFGFRITGLRSLLFSVISAGVLTLSITLITVFYGLTFRGQEEFFVAYFVLFIGLIILLIPLLKMNMTNKMVSSVLINISLNGFVLLVLLIFAIISIHQKAACQIPVTHIDYDYTYQNCPNIFEDLGFILSYIILILGFVFMYFYTAILQKWKAMPE